jgi:hypothetical protein
MSGNTASGRTGSAYDGEYYSPTLRLAMWSALADTRVLRPPSVRPNHLAAPCRRRAPWDVLLPWGEGFGIPNRSPDHLVRRAGRDHPIPIFAGSLWRERDVARRVGHGWSAIPGKKTAGIEPHPAHCVPTAERLWRLSTPSPPRVTRSQSRGLASSLSCRRVVAPVPNCPSQGSICASLQCSCKSQSLKQEEGE